MNILLVRTGGLGDSLLTLPVACRIRNLYPDARLHVLGNETMLAVAHLSGIFDGLHSVDVGGFYALYSDASPTKFLQSFFSRFETVYFFAAALKKKIIDTVISSGARNCYVLDPHQPVNSHRHIVEHLITILGESNTSSFSPVIPEITIGRTIKKERSGLIIHPGSGSHSKNWALKNFIRVADKVLTRVTFLLGPAEIERGMEKDIAKLRFPVVRTGSLSDLCDVLSGAELYVGNDSGVTHLASFCGTPVVGLFGPSNPVVWGPLGRRVPIVFSRDGTMNGISIEEVLDAVNAELR